MNRSLFDKIKVILQQGKNYMVALLLKAANCEQLCNNKKFLGFNNFIHNSEQGEVFLTEPIVFHPQLLQGLKNNFI